MKKILLLLTFAGLLFSSCEKGCDCDDENGFNGKYHIGQLVTCDDGSKGVVFDVYDGVKLVSVDERTNSFVTFESAKLWCENLGNGWRLPTIKELEVIFALKHYLNATLRDSGYRCFVVGYPNSGKNYLSSTVVDNEYQYFNFCGDHSRPIGGVGMDFHQQMYVRAVRDL